MELHLHVQDVLGEASRQGVDRVVDLGHDLPSLPVPKQHYNMNFLSLESKFQEIDRREAEKRVYFDPKTATGKKHLYIKDLKADYEYDNLIYGLGKYVK